MTTTQDKKRLSRMIESLEQGIEALNLVHSELLTDRVIEVFGTDYVDEEDLMSIAQEPELWEFARMLERLKRRLSAAKSKFYDDGSEPPF